MDAEVELAGHYGGIGFVREGVEVGQADGVDFVVDVEAGRGVSEGMDLKERRRVGCDCV